MTCGTGAFGSVEVDPSDTRVGPGFGIQLGDSLVVFQHLAVIICKQLYSGTMTLPATAGSSRVRTMVESNTPFNHLCQHVIKRAHDHPCICMVAVYKFHGLFLMTCLAIIWCDDGSDEIAFVLKRIHISFCSGMTLETANAHFSVLAELPLLNNDFPCTLLRMTANAMLGACINPWCWFIVRQCMLYLFP